MPSLRAVKFSYESITPEEREQVQSQNELIVSMAKAKQPGLVLPAPLINFASECLELMMEEIENGSMRDSNIGILSKLLKIIGYSNTTLNDDQVDKIAQWILANKDNILKWEQKLDITIPELLRLVEYVARRELKREEEFDPEDGPEGEENGEKNFKELQEIVQRIKASIIDRSEKNLSNLS